jgi:hypothetical protein
VVCNSSKTKLKREWSAEWQRNWISDENTSKCTSKLHFFRSCHMQKDAEDVSAGIGILKK